MDPVIAGIEAKNLLESATLYRAFAAVQISCVDYLVHGAQTESDAWGAVLRLRAAIESQRALVGFVLSGERAQQILHDAKVDDETARMGVQIEQYLRTAAASRAEADAKVNPS